MSDSESDCLFGHFQTRLIYRHAHWCRVLKVSILQPSVSEMCTNIADEKCMLPDCVGCHVAVRQFDYAQPISLCCTCGRLYLPHTHMHRTGAAGRFQFDKDLTVADGQFHCAAVVFAVYD